MDSLVYDFTIARSPEYSRATRVIEKSPDFGIPLNAVATDLTPRSPSLPGKGENRLPSPWRDLLNSQPDIEVVGEAADGEEALRVAERVQPDIVLMDITMPGMDGLFAKGRNEGQVLRPSLDVCAIGCQEGLR